jgi:hypothetical protein
MHYLLGHPRGPVSFSDENVTCISHLPMRSLYHMLVTNLHVIVLITHSASQGSSVSIVPDYGLDERGSIPGRGKMIFPLASVSRPALRPTQPPIQWVPGILSPGGNRGRGVTLTAHPHLVPSSAMSRSYTPLLASASMTCSGTALAF